MGFEVVIGDGTVTILCIGCSTNYNVGWVGQTFALAKSNESGGKKSRIRRSKEERKALVESFIKRYQNNNSGSFPSLNLTHKEVGGSFYTVRELVREIIQENRVLGPAKAAENEQEVDRFHEEYPLGSISIECQSHVSLSSNEPRVVSNSHQISKELDSTLNGKANGEQLQRLVSEQYIIGISLDKEYKEADKSPVQVNYDILHTEIQINQNLGSMENIVEISTPKVTPIATDIVVEAFPICSASKTSQEGKSVEAGKLTVNMEQHEAERLEAKPELNDSAYSGFLDEKSAEHLSDQLFETLSSSTAKGSTSTPGSKQLQNDVSARDDLTLQTTNQDLVTAGMEPKPALESAHNKNSNNTASNGGELLSQEAAAMKTKRDNQNAFSAEEAKNSTLNRTRLESWEGSSRRTAKAETNPVLAVFKAFVSAFMKFWTE